MLCDPNNTAAKYLATIDNQRRIERGTGKSTLLKHVVKAGDFVVFKNHEQAKCFQNSLGKFTPIRVIVCDANENSLFNINNKLIGINRSVPIYYDHVWIEEYHINCIQAAQLRLEALADSKGRT